MRWSVYLTGGVMALFLIRIAAPPNTGSSVPVPVEDAVSDTWQIVDNLDLT